MYRGPDPNAPEPRIDAEHQERLLREAATVLSAGPAVGVEKIIYPSLYGRQVRCRAVFVWPGIVRIFEAQTGELLAVSRPGQPEEVAAPTSAGPSKGATAS